VCRRVAVASSLGVPRLAWWHARSFPQSRPVRSAAERIVDGFVEGQDVVEAGELDRPEHGPGLVDDDAQRTATPLGLPDRLGQCREPRRAEDVTDVRSTMTPPAASSSASPTASRSRGAVSVSSSPATLTTITPSTHRLSMLTSCSAAGPSKERSATVEL